MKLKNVVTAVETGAYAYLINKELSDIKAVYALSKQQKQIETELKHYSKHRDKVLAKYGTENVDKKGEYTIGKENVDEYQKALEELLDVNVENICTVKIKIELIDKMSAVHMQALEGIVEFEGLDD